MMLSEYNAKIHEKAICAEERAEGHAEGQLSSIRNLMETM